MAVANKRMKIGSDLTVNYALHGYGPNYLLCLPRALGCAESDYVTLFNELDRQKFTLVALDFPGYGESQQEGLRKDLKPGYHKRDAIIAHKVMKKLNLMPYSILAWHDSGPTAVMIAHKHKTNVKKLILNNTSVLLTREEVAKHAEIRSLHKWSEDMREGFLRTYDAGYLQETWGDYVDEKIRIMSFERGDICVHMLHQLPQATLVLHGERNILIPFESAEFLADSIVNSKLIIRPGGDHMMHIIESDWFNKEVSDFIINDIPVVEVKELELHAY